MATTPAPQPGNCPGSDARRRNGSRDEDEGSRRYRTVYVDFQDFETRLASRHCDTGRGRYAPIIAATNGDTTPPTNGKSAHPALKPATVDGKVDGVRLNVQDAARAVLTWVAATLDGDDPAALRQTLDQCLRPGPDIERVNFAEIARQINETLGTDYSAKRIGTAIRHLRKAHAQAVAKQHAAAAPGASDASPASGGGGGVGRSRLRELREQLGDGELAPEMLAAEVLATVRWAAGRLIDNGYGEGIPDTADLEGLRAAIDRSAPSAPAGATPNGNGHAKKVAEKVAEKVSGTFSPVATLATTLKRAEADPDPELAVRLVIDGAAVVRHLMGPRSLPGVMAELNVLVVGRSLLDSPDYTRRLLTLADAAEALHEDDATDKLQRRLRRLPEDRRVPSPRRVASYCLNNVATHLLQRLFLGELTGGQHLAVASACIERMKQGDSGFQLLRPTQIIALTTVAKLTSDGSGAQDEFRRLGERDALAVLEDLAKYDNCPSIVKAARDHAVAVFPTLEHRLIYAG